MNHFEKITKSPDTLAKFLQTLPVLDGPWDEEFEKRFCVDCLCCDCNGCPHEEYRNNPLWWLHLETEENRKPAKEVTA